jgi:hypothetical protein
MKSPRALCWKQPDDRLLFPSDLEQPGSKQGAVAKLIRFAIDDKHYFLSKVFAQRGLAATRAEERDQLGSEDLKQVGKGIFAR